MSCHLSNCFWEIWNIANRKASYHHFESLELLMKSIQSTLHQLSNLAKFVWKESDCKMTPERPERLYEGMKILNTYLSFAMLYWSTCHGKYTADTFCGVNPSAMVYGVYSNQQMSLSMRRHTDRFFVEWLRINSQGKSGFSSQYGWNDETYFLIAKLH